MSQGATNRIPGRPKLVDDSPVRPDHPWERREIAAKVEAVLRAIEAPAIDRDTRMTLQRICYRAEYFRQDGPGKVTLLLRTVLESAGNENALVEPVVSAVAGCMRPGWTARGLEWIEAFDRIPLLEILQTLRGLGIFREKSLSTYLEIAVRNRLVAILGPDQPRPAAKPAKVKKPPKPPLRLSLVEQRMKIGAALRDLRKRHRCNKTYGRVRSKQFADLNSIDAAEYARVAGVYFDRPEIWQPGKVAWKILVMMASASVPAAVRQSLEQRILAGERVTAPDVRAAVAAHRRPSRRMAA